MVSVADGAIGIGAVFVCHHGRVQYVLRGHAGVAGDWVGMAGC